MPCHRTARQIACTVQGFMWQKWTFSNVKLMYHHLDITLCHTALPLEHVKKLTFFARCLLRFVTFWILREHTPFDDDCFSLRLWSNPVVYPLYNYWIGLFLYKNLVTKYQNYIFCRLRHLSLKSSRVLRNSSNLLNRNGNNLHQIILLQSLRNISSHYGQTVI